MSICTIGSKLNDFECHKLTHSRKTGFHKTCDLSAESKRLLLWRTGIQIEDFDEALDTI